LGEPEKIVGRETHRVVGVFRVNGDTIKHEMHTLTHGLFHQREAPLKVIAVDLAHAGSQSDCSNLFTKKVYRRLELVRIGSKASPHSEPSGAPAGFMINKLLRPMYSRVDRRSGRAGSTLTAFSVVGQRALACLVLPERLPLSE